jgi:serine/threonine protein kinase/TolA-binding protein
MSEVSLGRYKLIRLIGKGAVASVYEALDTLLKRHVAVKVMTGSYFEDEVKVKRFLREAVSAGKLTHPNIVPIYDIGEEEGKYYIAMGLIKGESLDKIIEAEAPLKVEKGLDWIVQIGEALKYAHSYTEWVEEKTEIPAQQIDNIRYKKEGGKLFRAIKGIIHRDIKPANVIIDSSGKAVITDFGIAKQEGEIGLTETDTSLGTPLYMSPEQFKGEQVDARSDIYSLGVIMYELFTGKPPFQAKDRLELMKKVCEEPPSPPRKINPTLPYDLETIILKCLEKEPAKRYQTMSEVLEDIQRFRSGESILAKRASVTEKLIRKIKQNKLIASLSIFLFISLVLGVHLWYQAYLNAKLERAGWELYFSDNFEREELGKNWKVISGDWKIKDGRLYIKGAAQNNYLLCNQKISGNIRLIYEGYFVGEKGGDISCFICGDEGMLDGEGYFFGFGAHNNTANLIQRKFVDLVTTKKFLPRSRKKYTVMVEREGSKLRMFVNRKLLLEYTDPSPLTGENHARFGLYTWDSEVYFDNFRVYFQPLPGRGSPLQLTDKLFEKGEYQAALQGYQEAFQLARREEIREEAKYKIGLCYQQLGEYDRARKCFQELVTTGKVKEYIRKANFELINCLLQEGEEAKVLTHLQEMEEKYTPSPAIAQFYNDLARQCERKGYTNLAFRAFSYLIEKYPNFNTQLILSDASALSIQGGFYQKSKELISKLSSITKEPRQRATLVDFRLGELALAEGHLNEAERIYCQIERKFPEELEILIKARLNRAEVVKEKGKTATAFRILFELQKDYSDMLLELKAEIFSRLSEWLIEQGEYQKASFYLNQILQGGSAFRRYFNGSIYQQGVIYLKTGQYSLAEKKFLKALRAPTISFRTWIGPYQNLCDLYVLMERPQKIKRLEKEIVSLPFFRNKIYQALSLKQEAMVCFLHGELEKAIDFYEQYIEKLEGLKELVFEKELLPHLLRAYLELASLYIHTEKLEKAKAIYKEYKEIVRNISQKLFFPEVKRFILIGKVFLLKEFPKEFPSEAFFYLGEEAWLRRKYLKAKEYYQKYLSSQTKEWAFNVVLAKKILKNGGKEWLKY